MKKLLLALSVIAALGGFSYGVNAAIEDWSTTAGNNNSASPDGFPEGMAPSGINNAAREVMAQVRRWAEQGVFAKYATESGGSTTAFAMTPDIQPSNYVPGALYWFKASTTNTGASTLNIAELGAKDIQQDAQALAGGEIVQNDVVGVVYDGTQFQIISQRDGDNAKMTRGLTLNQGAADDEIVALKSSDVAHGVTDDTETDTYSFIAKGSAALGGVRMQSYSETGTVVSMTLRAITTDDDTTKGTGGVAPFYVDVRKKSGTTSGAVGADANLFAIAEAGGTRFIVDEDGDIHTLSGNGPTAFDHHDDLALLAGLRGSALMTPEQAEKWDLTRFIDYARPILEREGIVTYGEDGSHFVSHRGMIALLIDTIRQQASKQENEIEALKAEIRALKREIRPEAEVVLH